MINTAFIDSSGAETIAVVAAKAGRKIRVVSFFLVAAGSTTIKFQSASTDKGGAMSMVVGVPLAQHSALTEGAGTPVGLLETATGEALNLVKGAVQLSGWVNYIVTPP